MTDIHRIHPHVVVRKPSPNWSSRSSRIQLITIHATVSRNVQHSAADLAAIGDWFANPSSQVSSHVCTDGDGNSARFVADAHKAWHCAAYNSASLGIEQIFLEGHDVWRRDEYRETARWVARWSLMYGVPIRHGAVGGGSVLRSGVVRHSDLGALGGSHTDPGPEYNLDAMLHLARFYRGKLLEAHH